MPRFAALAIPGILLLAVLAAPSLAGISRPDSYLVASPDGTRVLVMLGYPPQYDRAPTAALPDGRVVNLRATFPSSGVYGATTLDPLWQVGWYALPRDLLYSDDFRSVVRVSREAFPSRNALCFYADGKLVRTYACADLLTGLRSPYFLPFTTWDWHYKWYEDYDLDPTHTRLVLTTARRRMHVADREIDFGLQEFYTFDLSTGTLLTRRRVGAWRVWMNATVTVVAVVTLVWVLRILWKWVNSPSDRVGFPVQTRSNGG